MKGHDMNPVPAMTGVGLTAIEVARTRAVESRRPDRLFDDPYAERFVEASGVPPLVPDGVPRTPDAYFAIRTRFFDERLLDASRSCRQVVILAAGLDMRAFRLRWPGGVRLFELDQAAVLAFKQGVLDAHGAAPTCERVAVAGDLRADWPAALLAAGLRREEPVAWLLEGLLFYLDSEANDRVLADVRRVSAPGSRLALEHVNGALLRGMKPTLDALARHGAPWQSTVDRPIEWLAARGFRATAADVAHLAARYGRPFPAPKDTDARAWLLDAVLAP